MPSPGGKRAQRPLIAPLQVSLRAAAASAALGLAEAGVRAYLNPWLLDNRRDAVAFVGWGGAVGLAAGALIGLAAGLARRWIGGRRGAYVLSVLYLPISWMAFILIGPAAGDRIGAGAGLVLAAAILVASGRSMGRPHRAFGLPPRISRAIVGSLLAAVVLCGAISVGSVLLWAAAGAAPPPGAPNVLLITIDTLRADGVASLRASAGGGRTPPSATPAIDALAAEGVLFTHTVTPCPRTPQAIASLLTGTYPATHGLTNLFLTLGFGNETIAENLREHGWRTAAVTTNQLVGRRSGCAQGFDHYESSTGLRRPFSTLMATALAHALAPGAVESAVSSLPGMALVGEGAGATTDRALRALEGVRDRPYFLWVHYLDPHWPYWPPEPWRVRYDPASGDPFPLYDDIREGKRNLQDMIDSDASQPEAPRLMALYAAETAYVDSEVGRLVRAALEGPGGERTIVILTSDHGEAFGEHGYAYSHGLQVYEESVRVPLIVRPAGGAAASVVSETVSLIDLAPTIFEMLQLPVSDSLEGTSLLAAIAGGAGGSGDLSERDLFAESDLAYQERSGDLTIPGEAGKARSIRRGAGKLIRIPHDHANAKRIDPDLGAGWLGRRTVMGFSESTRLGPSAPDQFLLFDLAADPSETTSLLDARPEAAARFLSDLDAWAIAGSRGPAAGVREDEGLVELLRSLGYLGGAGDDH